MAPEEKIVYEHGVEQEVYFITSPGLRCAVSSVALTFMSAKILEDPILQKLLYGCMEHGPTIV